MHLRGIGFRKNARINSSFDLCKGNRVHFDTVEMRSANALDSTNCSDFALTALTNAIDRPLCVLDN